MSLPLSDSCHTCACIFSSDEICLLAATRRLIQQENEDMSWLKNKVLAPPYARGWKIDHSPENKNTLLIQYSLFLFSFKRVYGFFLKKNATAGKGNIKQC